MKNKLCEKITFLTLLIFLLNMGLSESAPTLDCQVTTNCGATTIFKMSELTNSHAESYDSNNYAYNVCCQIPGYTVENSCGTETSFEVLGLASVTNAHVEKASYGEYPIKACLSSTNRIVFSCIYTTEDCVAAGYQTCLATISDYTNAHIADCFTDPYPTKVCCKAASMGCESTCSTTDCPAGSYCDSPGGECKTPDESQNVCLNCAADQTAGYTWSWPQNIFQDAGKAYSTNTDIFTSLFNSDTGPCSEASGGPCFDSTGAAVNHKPALATGNCCGDDASEFYKTDYYGGECTSSVDSCVWSTGDAQSSDSGNKGWWCYLGKWEECTGAAHVGKHHGSAVCVGSGTGWDISANVLPENNYGANACLDGLDNDGNGLKDCDDPSCSGSLIGTVSNQDAQLVYSADLITKKGLTIVKSSITNPQGEYNMGTLNCGSYTLTASHSQYVPQTKNIEILPNQQSTVDFQLVLGTSCEQDCTFAADDIVHASCEGKNGCTFYDAIAKAACDNSQPGWVRDYDADNYVICASGAPQPKVEIQAEVTCAKGTLVKVTRIVLYNGKPVKLVVATCG